MALFMKSRAISIRLICRQGIHLVWRMTGLSIRWVLIILEERPLSSPVGSGVCWNSEGTEPNDYVCLFFVP